MTRTKKIIKKKLKQPDEFITLTDRAVRFFTHRLKSIAIGGGIVLALIIFLFLFQKWGEKKEESAYQMLRLSMETYQAVSSPYREASPQEYKTVLEGFDQVIAKFPGTSSGKIAILYKGNLYLRLGEFENAAKAYEAFLRKIGKERIYRSFALNGLGYCYEGKKEYEKAANTFQKVVDLGESFQLADAYLGLGRCYEKMGKAKEAAANYKNFMKVSKKSEMTNIVLRKLSVLEKQERTP
jgi:tetratricopeptide (TPR) repeat protein